MSHLSETEYQALLSRLDKGVSDIHIARHHARHFFLTVPGSEVLATTGQSITGAKLAVIGCLVIAFLLIIACLWLITGDQGWLAMMTVPLVGIFWTILAGFTTEMGSLASSVIILALAFVLAWLLPTGYQLPLALFALSVFFYRLAHIVAQRFLEKLVTTSFEAWDMLADHIIVNHDEALG